MKKGDKKIENTIRVALTRVCEKALDEVVGFQWLTHLVDYNQFPDSLCVICVFDTHETLINAMIDNSTDYLKDLIKSELGSAGFKFRNTNGLVKFDTEENIKLKNVVH